MMDRKKAFSPYMDEAKVKYLRDWATSKERADLIEGLKKPHGPVVRLSDLPARTEEEERLDAYGVRMMMDGIRREMEATTVMFKGRKSTKH